MSERLAISATFSVLMMAVYVLFGGDAAHAPISRGDLAPAVSISMPSVSLDARELLQ